MSMTTRSHPTRIFIVEDDPIYQRLAKYVAELNPEHEVHVFTSGKDCIDNLFLNPSIISLDYSLPDMTGREIFEKIKAYNEAIGIIILSGQNDISVAVELLKNGAYDYIVKNEEARNRLQNALENIKSKLVLQQEVEQLKDKLGDKYSFQKMAIGNSPSMQRLYKLLEKAIRTNISVSITGETGAGKEVAARCIHYNSTRKKGNFVAVNVSAIPRDLLESELFGHEKGAFTGATTRKIGFFEHAHNGTLFLDEIAEMEINMQAKLLRAIQEREITRVGGTSTVKFDTRIIVATHKDLASEVEKGNFREDLYYRLLGLPIEVPPLRDRGNDILLLMRHFLNEFSRTNSLGKITVNKTAKKKLMSYQYPGNVRELKAIIELAAVMCEDNTIQEEDITFNSPRRTENFMNNELTLREYTSKIIYHFLDRYDRDVLMVAKKLDIGKSTIYRLLKEEESMIKRTP